MCVSVSQNARDSQSWKLSKFSLCVLFLSQIQEKRKGKTFSCEATADLPLSDKGSFLKQDEWLQEIEEHERKPGTSEKQSDLLT